MNVHGVSDVRQTEIQISETLVSDTAIEKLKGHKSPGIVQIVQIPAVLIKAVGRTICCEIHNLINYI